MPTQMEVTSSLSYTQKGRAISVKSVLGPDVLLLESFEGKETVAGGFKYTLGLLAKDPGISASKLIRTPITVTMHLSNDSDREITGLVSRFVQLDQAEGLTVYEAEIRPWFWFLSLTSDYRVWQNLTVPEIVKTICSEAGFSDQLVLHLAKAQKPQEYRVQYGETHLDFICRLMEEEGIYWFAQHEDGKCNMVIADANNVSQTTLKLRLSTIGHAAEDDEVLSWFNVAQDVRPGKFTTMDYNFEKPSTQLKGEHAGKVPGEVVEFPGGFAERDDGNPLASLRYQEIIAEQVEAEGAGRCRALTAGGKIEISKHPNKALNKAYLVTSVKQSAKLGDFRSGGDAGLAFKSSFTAIPFDTPYRPERTTPLPRAYGYESAVVVGPAGEEIFTDEYGRVRVQFFWDRKGKKDDKSSCWVRVSTLWAGKGWGAISTPRIGQEVLVAYVNGDPEDPIVVGRVYNAEQMPPYALPGNKTQSGIKTRSALKGSPDNFNEIRFEDKKGSEQLFIHAEKNQDIEVEKDETHWVGHDRSKKIDNNETTKIGKSRTESVGTDETITIGGSRTESVGKNETITISGDRQETVSGSETVDITKARNNSVGNNDSLSVTGNQDVSIGKNASLNVDESRTTSIKKNDELSVGKKLVVTAEDEITLTAGDASIVMKKNGEITISGKDITVNGSGKITVKASSDLVLKGSKVAAN